MKFVSIKVSIFFGIILSAVSCREDGHMFLLQPPSNTGVDFINELKPTQDLNILTYLYYYNGAGVAAADFNGDGLNDLYFVSNQGKDKLYLNRGNFKFEDITDRSGIKNDEGWSTGVTQVDVNNDGLLDIYICKIGSYESLEGENLLFVNQGTDEGNVPIFKEMAKEYGLNIKAFSTQSAFFDYDLDGDLDMYLLCHSVYPNRSYGKGQNRSKVDSLAGDKFFENINGVYTDVTKSTGILQGKIGYGLGIAIGDLNQDGYPDIYVGNDFFENDYLYQNNGNKTFTELNSADASILGHTSHYSMGNSIVDINNDGKADIMSLDMLPENLITLKSSGVEDGYSIYNRFLSNGYSPQYMQNTLHLNKGAAQFSEVGFLSGIAATEWSWGVMVADYDLDGFKDIYITNGIRGATNDMDYINFISQDHIQEDIDKNIEGGALKFTEHIPEKEVANYAYRNTGNVSFTNVTANWFNAPASFSNGGAYVDLDNDGDLDIVVNNVDQDAFIFRNQANDLQDKNYITIKFKGDSANKLGIGAKVELFAGELYVFEENFPVRSYLSSVPNDMVIGLGENKTIDSIRVSWSNTMRQTLKGINANQSILLEYRNAEAYDIKKKGKSNNTYLTNTDFKLDFLHSEESTLDFDRDPLVPFALSNEGPKIEIADVNGDSLDDIVIGGAKMQPSAVLVQNISGLFERLQPDLFALSAKSEDLDQMFFDADNDGDKDLLVVSGGNEFKSGEPLKPRLYLNESGKFFYKESEFEGIAINASVVSWIDLENDGDNDVIICSNAVPGKFGENAVNYIFENKGAGHFENIIDGFSKEFKNVGLITDIKVADFDNNGLDDILVVGTWMPVTLFLNNSRSFEKMVIKDTEGWWRSVVIEDFDKDGDLDFVAGNWGLNSRLTASSNEPIRLYKKDFDNNGTSETLVTYFYQGQETFLSSKDELTKQMPFIKKKYTSYHEFAKAKIDEVVDISDVDESHKKEAKVLSTCYFENNGNNSFSMHKLPFSAQQSTVNSIAADDFNGDGYPDLLMVGNNYEISTQLGRLDASHGVLLLNDKSGFFKEDLDQSFNVAGAARDVKKINILDEDYYVVTINNGSPMFLKMNRKD